MCIKWAFVWTDCLSPLFRLMLCSTHQREIHDLYDPDGEGQVNDHGDQEQQQEEVEASFPPAVQTHRVHGAAAWPLEMQGLGGEDKLLLGNLENKDSRLHVGRLSRMYSVSKCLLSCTTRNHSGLRHGCVILQSFPSSAASKNCENVTWM